MRKLITRVMFYSMTGLCVFSSYLAYTFQQETERHRAQSNILALELATTNEMMKQLLPTKWHATVNWDSGDIWVTVNDLYTLPVKGICKRGF